MPKPKQEPTTASDFEVTGNETVAEIAADEKEKRFFTEVEDFSREIEIDEDLGLIRVSGSNRKGIRCSECGRFPITRPDKYMRIVKRILMARGTVMIEGMAVRGTGVALAVAKELRQDLNEVKIKTTWSFPDGSPFLAKVDDPKGNYQFGIRIVVNLK